jgi:hypothetical protein
MGGSLRTVTRAEKILFSGKRVVGVVAKMGGKWKRIGTVWRGAHPGGTAAIGEVVDNELRVKGREGPYVCDVSVFPFAPGLPPILTITAIGKWLGKRM